MPVTRLYNCGIYCIILMLPPIPHVCTFITKLTACLELLLFIVASTRFDKSSLTIVNIQPNYTSELNVNPIYLINLWSLLESVCGYSHDLPNWFNFGNTYGGMFRLFFSCLLICLFALSPSHLHTLWTRLFADTRVLPNQKGACSVLPESRRHKYDHGCKGQICPTSTEHSRISL